ncbi:MAG TPA: hypothetical protein VGA04_17215 [Streptosporangiaceae bacterium]
MVRDEDVSYVWHEAAVPPVLEITQVYGYLLCPVTARVLIQDNDGAFNLGGGRPERLDHAEQPDLHIRARPAGITGHDLVTEVGDTVPDDPDLAFFPALAEQGGRPVQVPGLTLPTREQKPLLVHAVLDQHAARDICQPAMHLPHWHAGRSRAFVPGELSHPVLL